MCSGNSSEYMPIFVRMSSYKSGKKNMKNVSDWLMIFSSYFSSRTSLTMFYSPVPVVHLSGSNCHCRSRDTLQVTHTRPVTKHIKLVLRPLQ